MAVVGHHSQVKKVISRLGQSDLGVVQVAALFALGFFGFLRWDDLSRLTVDSLQFAGTHLAIFLTQRKNYQFRNGSWVFIARSDISPCPVAVIEKFIRIGRHDSSSRLFCQILKTKKRMELREEPMSYSRANELIKQELPKERLEFLAFMVSIVLEQEEHRQQQLWVYLIGCSSGREDGVVSSKKITTSRSPLSRC